MVATLNGYHARTIYSVKWSKLSNLIATGCSANSIHIFRENEPTSSSGDESKFSLVGKEENAHSQDCNCVDWNPTRAGLLASCSDDGSIKLWNFSE